MTASPHLLTDEQAMIKEMAAEFATREVLPLANELDPVKGDIPDELVRKMAAMGYFGIRIPVEYVGGWQSAPSPNRWFVAQAPAPEGTCHEAG